MVAVIIIILVLFALAMIRLSIIVRVEEYELYIWVKIAFFKILAYPESKKSGAKTDRNILKISEDTKKADDKSDDKELTKLLLKAVWILIRKLGIKSLVFHYTAGGEDPADTALQYGNVSAVVYSMLPEICRMFKVKNQDVSVNVDFDLPEPKIELEFVIGLFLWQLIYIIKQLDF